jgi:hypothetical protein
MKIFMLWHGGSSYSCFDQFNRADCEEYPTIQAARDEFQARVHNSYYPCVSAIPVDAGGPSAWLCFSDPYQDGQLYPDRVLSFGPRGGLREEPA